MQSDTFLNNTDSEDEEYSSDSSGDLPENNNVGVKYDVPKDYSGKMGALTQMTNFLEKFLPH